MGQRCRPSGNGRSADSAACGKASRPVLGDRAVHHSILGFTGRVVAREGPTSQYASGYRTVVDMCLLDDMSGGVWHGFIPEMARVRQPQSLQGMQIA